MGMVSGRSLSVSEINVRRLPQFARIVSRPWARRSIVSPKSSKKQKLTLPSQRRLIEAAVAVFGLAENPPQTGGARMEYGASGFLRPRGSLLDTKM